MSIIDTSETLNVVIREMSLQDLDFVLAIENDSFSDAWPLIAFKQCLLYNENYTLHSAKTNEVLGYMIGIGTLEEFSIYNIAIKSSHQRKGLATYLLKSIIDSHAKKYEHYYLEVRKSNEKAKAFYTNFGFEEVYTRKNYYSNPVEDALVLRLRIQTDE